MHMKCAEEITHSGYQCVLHKLTHLAFTMRRDDGRHSPLYRWGSQGTERPGKARRVTQLDLADRVWAEQA